MAPFNLRQVDSESQRAEGDVKVWKLLLAEAGKDTRRRSYGQ